MKNIYVLPTDKLSRLYLGKNGNFVFGMMQTSVQSKNDHFCNQHIYITSDKEINDGDWVIKISSLYKGGGSIQKFSFIDRQFKDITFKKVILTTDQDLIQDNVQAIDDEFLEWFVKNPSCEWVEVEKGYLGMGGFCKSNEIISKDKIHYKIIIPKEEPKTNLEKLPFPELIKEFAEYYKNIPLIEELKQETVEEAAEKYARKQCDDMYDNESLTGESWGWETSLDFIAGAKWQQEQDKKLYSEREVESLLHKFMQSQKPDWHGYSTTKWFERFKKK